MIVNSNSTINQMIQKVQEKAKSYEPNESQKTSNIPKENFEKNNESADRYNFLTANGWLDNSPIVKDEKLNTAFRGYVDNMSHEDFRSLLIIISSDFLPQLVQNDNGEVVNGSSLKNPDIELASFQV